MRLLVGKHKSYDFVRVNETIDTLMMRYFCDDSRTGELDREPSVGQNISTDAQTVYGGSG